MAQKHFTDQEIETVLSDPDVPEKLKNVIMQLMYERDRNQASRQHHIRKNKALVAERALA